MRSPGAHVLLAVFLALLCAAATWAQAPATASEFYARYRKVFESAKRVEDIMPFMATSTRAEVEKTPAKDREQMFELIKLMGAFKTWKITQETPTPQGATLTVQAVDADGASSVGTITIVREDGAFKLGRESWRSK